MFKVNRLVVTILLFCILTSLFLIAFSSAQLTDSSILKMQGSTWSISVDSTLQTDLASKNVPYVSVAKAGAEKELFLTLNSLEDCKAGQIEFKVQTQGLTVYKQLPLDKELNPLDYDFLNATVAMQKDRVMVSRPENVVNSFACYNSSGSKVLHIYASQLIDAKGNKVYVDSELKDGLLTVYLDQKWLDSAVFPVVVDPSFGYTSVGSSAYYKDHYWIYTCKFTAPNENGSINSMSWYLGTPAESAKFGIYSEDTGSPKDILAQTGTISLPDGTGWRTESINYAFSANEVLFLAWIGNDGQNSYYDSGDTEQTYAVSNYPNLALADPFSTASNYPALLEKTNRILSVYVNYTTSEPTPTPTPTATPTPSPNTITISASSTLYVNLVLLLFFVLADLYFCLRPVKLLNFIVGFFGIVVVLGVMSAGALGGAWFFGLFVVVVGVVCLLRGTRFL